MLKKMDGDSQQRSRAALRASHILPEKDIRTQQHEFYQDNRKIEMNACFYAPVVIKHTPLVKLKQQAALASGTQMSSS